MLTDPSNDKGNSLVVFGGCYYFEYMANLYRLGWVAVFNQVHGDGTSQIGTRPKVASPAGKRYAY